MTWQERQLDERHLREDLNQGQDPGWVDPPPSNSAIAIFRLTAGPDGDNLYTGRKQKFTDFGVSADVSETNYKIEFINISGVLASAGAGGPLNGKKVLAIYVGRNTSGDQIWIGFDLYGINDLVAP
jgi:hypothetical protein